LEAPSAMRKLNDDFENVVAGCFSIENKNPNLKKIASTLRSKYFVFDKIDERSFDGLGQVKSLANIIFHFYVIFKKKN
jgi:hypothetical protein